MAGEKNVNGKENRWSKWAKGEDKSTEKYDKTTV